MLLAIVTGQAREGANRTHSHSRISCGVTCASPGAACVVTGHVPWKEPSRWPIRLRPGKDLSIGDKLEGGRVSQRSLTGTAWTHSSASKSRCFGRQSALVELRALSTHVGPAHGLATAHEPSGW